MGERYSFSLTTFRWAELVIFNLSDDGGFAYHFCFSPSGKLVQIEYALAAVAAGAPSVGIKGLNLRI